MIMVFVQGKEQKRWPLSQHVEKSGNLNLVVARILTIS